MKRTKFTLAPKPASPGSPRSGPKRPGKSDSLRFRSSGPAVPNLDIDEESELETADRERVLLPRAQLELEYKAALQERDRVLHELAQCLLTLMKPKGDDRREPNV